MKSDQLSLDADTHCRELKAQVKQLRSKGRLTRYPTGVQKEIQKLIKNYSRSEVSRYLNIPKSTIASWGFNDEATSQGEESLKVTQYKISTPEPTNPSPLLSLEYTHYTLKVFEESVAYKVIEFLKK